MRIKTTYNNQDLDFCYDVLIFTVIAMVVIITIGKLLHVC